MPGYRSLLSSVALASWVAAMAPLDLAGAASASGTYGQTPTAARGGDVSDEWARDEQDADKSTWGDDDWDDDAWSEGGDALLWSGFAEAGLGSRLGSNAVNDNDLVLGEARLSTETQWAGAVVAMGFKADVLYDEVTGKAGFDLRELTAAFSPAPSVDLKLGRQVLTWGTGDFLFLNDLFPKDWVSFFNGRDDEYLKAPSDTVRASWFTDVVNVDLAWTPVFEPDHYLTGERFSFFSPLAGGIVAPDPPAGAVLPRESLGNGEWALRLFRKHQSTEYALYAYRGFYKSPESLDAMGRATFTRLDAYGASLRRGLFGGLFNAETSYYASRDDASGDDPFVPNSQFRLLLGYEQELVTNLTFAGQGYLERIENHHRLLANSPAPQFEPEKWRSLVTTRLTYRAMQDKLFWSMFGFYSPTEQDFHLRPKLEYRHNDSWTYTAGLNLFGGGEAHTFFGQFDDNDNAYLRVRFNY